MSGHTKGTRQTLPGRLEANLRLLAEISSLFLLLGFILSSLLNGIIFSAWGISFMQAASPADVLMSGLQFAALIAVPTMVSLSINWVGLRRSVWSKSDRHVQLVALGLVVVAALPVASYMSSRSVTDGIGPYAVVLGTGVMIAILAAVSWRSTPSGQRGSPLAKSLLTLLVAGAMIMVGGATVLVARVEHGYEPMLTYIEEAEFCTAAPAQVLWIGADTVIVRCGLQDPAQPLHVLRAPGDLRFTIDRSRTFTCAGHWYSIPRHCKFANADTS